MPFVSAIIPARNEEKFISKCLDSILNNDYPKESLEIFIIDGVSEDKTKEIVNSYLPKNPFIKLLDNPKKYAPVAQNIGVKNSKGDIIIIMDAHVTYEKDYISKCVKYLLEYNADNVGGVLITTPAEDTLVAKAISQVLSSPFGAGNSYFRTGAKEVIEADTVPYGCFKREVFDRIGLYNEKMSRSYDMDFNLRLKKAGGKILLVPEIVGYYHPRSNIRDFWDHNFLDGFWVTFPLKFGIKAFYLRHLVPLFFIGALFLTFLSPKFFLIIFLYLSVSFCFSFQISKKEKEWQYFFILPLIFGIRHIAYGLGSIWGLIKAFF